MKGIFISEANGLRLGITLTITFAVISISSAISAYVFKRKSNALNSKIRELEASLKSSIDKCVSERQGRIRAQQALRKELTQPKSENLKLTYYPMSPIGTIHSCFSTRNGTPRQPLLVPLARACLVFNTTRVPPASLEGLADYSHCWVLYILRSYGSIHLNQGSRQRSVDGQVRVPRLKGGRMGVFATRSPHRPCPIGLTVAKIAIFFSLVIGGCCSQWHLFMGIWDKPVLDVKPYVPYCDSIKEAAVPNWLTEDNLLTVASVSFSGDFTSALENCWTIAEKKSLYASPGEFQSLIKQVLSWDIRSLSQRNRPHDALSKKENDELLSNTSDVDEHQDETAFVHEREQNSLNSKEVIYHLILDGLNISYKIDQDANVIVESVSNSDTFDNSSNSCNYLTWKDKLQ
ncbi:hypothetical protein Lal_00040699 [Lupinus albus]|nr:hypothetical protein Lal_00040699 [Lupinus albus]